MSPVLRNSSDTDIRVSIAKQELLDALTANREQHRRIFEEACEGYRAKAVEILEQNIANIKALKLERIRALREAWKTFSKPEVQEQVSQARYRGAGFVIYDELGYDIQLAKDSVGHGWASLIEKVFDAKPPDLRIVQVKEKYAGLRIYTDRIDKHFDDLLFDVQNESLTICEECSKPGLVREG